jgi:hypothetical protein
LNCVRELRKGTNGFKSLAILERQLKQLKIRKNEINQKITSLTKEIDHALAKGKKPGLKKNSVSSHQSFHLPGFFSSAEWIYRDTRHNRNLGTSLLTGKLASYFPMRQFKRIAIMKDIVDPYHLLSDEDYGALVARLHQRDMRLHKNQSIKGTFLDINSRGSYVEPISSDPSEFHYVQDRIVAYRKDFNSTQITSEEALNEKVGDQPFFYWSTPKGGFNERVHETHEMEKQFESFIQNLKERYSSKGLVVIKNLSDQTDSILYTLVKKYQKKLEKGEMKGPQINLVVLTTRHGLEKIDMPGKLSRLENLYQFSNEKKLNEYIDRLLLKKDAVVGRF